MQKEATQEVKLGADTFPNWVVVVSYHIDAPGEGWNSDDGVEVRYAALNTVRLGRASPNPPALMSSIRFPWVRSDQDADTPVTTRSKRGRFFKETLRASRSAIGPGGVEVEAPIKLSLAACVGMVLHTVDETRTRVSRDGGISEYSVLRVVKRFYDPEDPEAFDFDEGILPFGAIRLALADMRDNFNISDENFALRLQHTAEDLGVVVGMLTSGDIPSPAPNPAHEAPDIVGELVEKLSTDPQLLALKETLDTVELLASAIAGIKGVGPEVAKAAAQKILG